jgi:hypothetical protein
VFKQITFMTSVHFLKTDHAKKKKKVHSHDAFHSMHFCIAIIFNIPTKRTHTAIYIYIYNYRISPTCFCTYCTILKKNSSVIFPKLSAYCNVVTLVTKHKIYHMWVLRYVQLLEQYMALCYGLEVT